MRLDGTAAVVTGADSGIGQAAAIAFAEEGADVAAIFLHDSDGAARTRRLVEVAGRRALALRPDRRDPAVVAHELGAGRVSRPPASPEGPGTALETARVRLRFSIPDR